MNYYSTTKFIYKYFTFLFSYFKIYFHDTRYFGNTTSTEHENTFNFVSFNFSKNAEYTFVTT